MASPRRIYLDNAATTRPLAAVVDAMADAALDAHGNPSSGHAFGPPAKRLLDDAREFLRENPDLAHEIENKVREAMGVPLLPARAED